MSRESAIEAIVKIAEEARDEEDFFNDITQALAEHGFVHLDDIAEGFKVVFSDKEVIHKCGKESGNKTITCRAAGCWYRPATIREVLSDLAVRKEA